MHGITPRFLTLRDSNRSTRTKDSPRCGRAFIWRGKFELSRRFDENFCYNSVKCNWFRIEIASYIFLSDEMINENEIFLRIEIKIKFIDFQLIRFTN